MFGGCNPPETTGRANEIIPPVVLLDACSPVLLYLAFQFTGWHLRATFQLATETRGFQTPLRIVGSKGDVSLALKSLSHSWQRHKATGRSASMAAGPRPGVAVFPFSKRNMWRDHLSNFNSPNTAGPTCDAQGLSSHLGNLLLAHSQNQTFLFAPVETPPSCRINGPSPRSYPGMSSQHIPPLRVGAKLVHVQSNHRLGCSPGHQTTRGRQLLDQLIFPGNCLSCLR